MSEQTKPSDDLVALRGRLSNELFNSVIPFWTGHAIDGAGGINTCIRDDGVIISRDKWLWSQWKADGLYVMVSESGASPDSIISHLMSRDLYRYAYVGHAVQRFPQRRTGERTAK